MKTVTRRLSSIVKLGLFAGLLLTGHQAAAQTAAGTPVNNTAEVQFAVGGIDQAPIPSDTATFWVDRRVAFVITQNQGDLTDTTPGLDDVFIEFRLRNDSNDTLDFLLADSVASASTNIRSGQDATGDAMTDTRIRVAASPVGGGSETPDLATVITDVTGLASGEEILIRVYANTPTALTNGDIPGIVLSATAALAGTELLETAGPDRQTAIDNVFVNGADPGTGFSVETQVDGFRIADAELTAAKIARTVYDPVNLFTPDAKPIPGAYVEYEFTITNGGTTAADSVVIVDTLDITQTVMRAASYESDPGSPPPPSGANVRFDGTAWCVADNDNTDGCTWDPLTGDISIAVPGTIAPAGSVVVEFQVIVQ